MEGGREREEELRAVLIVPDRPERSNPSFPRRYLGRDAKEQKEEVGLEGAEFPGCYRTLSGTWNPAVHNPAGQRRDQ